jgi:hypothetical protein
LPWSVEREGVVAEALEDDERWGSGGGLGAGGLDGRKEGEERESGESAGTAKDWDQVSRHVLASGEVKERLE